MIVGIELHALAVMSVLIFLFPGILHGDVRKIVYGAAAAVVIMLAYVGIDSWVSAQYPVPPPEYAADLGPRPGQRASAVPALLVSLGGSRSCLSPPDLTP